MGKDSPSEKGPSEKSKAIAELLMLILSYFLLYFYISDIKTSIESMSQDYPSAGLFFLSDRLPLLIPFPSTIFLVWKEVPKSRKYIKFITAIAFLLGISGIISAFSIEGISIDMSYSVFAEYISVLIVAAVLICGSTRNLIARGIDMFYEKS